MTNRDDRGFLGWAAFGVALAALFLGVFAVATTDDGSDASVATDAGAGAGDAAAAADVTVVDVELGSMVFEPSEITVPPGQVQLAVTNGDVQPHDLNILGTATSELQPGETEMLDLGVLDEGVYEFWCELPGHAAAGMTGELHVVAGAAASAGEVAAAAGDDSDGHGGGGGDDDHLHGFDTWQDMDAAHMERALRFVEEEKSTFGGQTLEPTVLPDGTKEFDLVAEIVDWEVEPGVIVEAWTYNGVVPAPHIDIEVGDTIRVNLDNQLPVSTSIHWHGVILPNDQDGVPPYTQDPIAPGETYTYEFVAEEKAVGIYHSHSSAEQLLNGMFGAITIGEMEMPESLIDDGFAAEPDQTINMVLNDAGTIGLTLNGKSFPATEVYEATVGDTIMVHYYNEGLMPHPMHMHGVPGWVIARDGVELEQPWAGDTFNIAPGERWTVVHKVEKPGVWAWHCHIITHAERPDGMFGMVTAMIVEEADAT